MPLEELLPEETKESLEEIAENNIVFCAKVSAYCGKYEVATNHLGGCIYKTEEEFYTAKGCYFDDMVDTVIREAKEEVQGFSKVIQTPLFKTVADLKEHLKGDFWFDLPKNQCKDILKEEINLCKSFVQITHGQENMYVEIRDNAKGNTLKIGTKDNWEELENFVISFIKS